MFCPLCRAEYRSGVTVCSDCHTALVGSLDEARSSSAMLWTGDRQRTLDKVLAALDAQSIPSHIEEPVNVGPRVTLLGLPLSRMKSTFGYEVWVVSSDLERARSAIAGVKPDWFSSFLDEMNWRAIARRVVRVVRGRSRISGS
jgi:hypothetical protein